MKYIKRRKADCLYPCERLQPENKDEILHKREEKTFHFQNEKTEKRRNSLITKGYKVVFRMASKMPVKSKTIIFESFNGKQYSCNPRAIYEYMQINHPEYKMYWSVNKQYAPPLKRRAFNTLTGFLSSGCLLWRGQNIGSSTAVCLYGFQSRNIQPIFKHGTGRL